jgi:tRNA A37 threonylcarbamoyltransferase TsaD
MVDAISTSGIAETAARVSLVSPDAIVESPGGRTKKRALRTYRTRSFVVAGGLAANASTGSLFDAFLHVGGTHVPVAQLHAATARM